MAGWRFILWLRIGKGRREMGGSFRATTRFIGNLMMSSTSSVTSYSSLHDGNKLHQLEIKEQTMFSTATQFYFGNKYNRFVLATQKNLLDLFPKGAALLKDYCKRNHIDFGKRADLEKLISYVERLAL